MAAFINIDLAAVGSWAERNGIAYTSYSDLASRTEVYDLNRGGIEQVNRDLDSDSSMTASQVRRFLILQKELDADDGEVTRTETKGVPEGTSVSVCVSIGVARLTETTTIA